MANKYLSKIKLSNVEYFLKDEEMRAIIAAYGTAVEKDYETTLTDGGNLPTGAAVKSYVDAQIGTIHKFDVRIYESLPTASADTMYILALVADASSGAEKDNYLEYITVRSGTEGSYTYAWEQIGSTKVDLKDYVKKTAKIAGIDLQDDITVDELITALGLKDFAFADTASGDYTPAGSVNVNAVPGGNYQGDVTGTATGYIGTDVYVESIEQGTVEIAAGDIAVKAIKNNASGSFELTGTVSTPTITVTPSTAKGNHITAVNTPTEVTLPTFTKTTADFATEGVTVTINGEELVFGDAAKSAAVDSTTWTTGSVTPGTAVQVAEDTYVTGIASATSSDITFTGDKYDLSNKDAESFATVGVAGVKNSAPAEITSTINTGATADVKLTNQMLTGSFVGTAATITVEAD